MKGSMVCKAVICLLGLLGFAVPAGAQTVTDERVWGTFIVQSPIGADSSKWRLSLESYFRSREGVDQLDTAAVRPVLLFTVDKHSSVGGGYATALTFPASGGVTVEHRYFEQYVWTGAMAGGTLSMRSRIEQRVIEGNSGVDHRFREQVRLTRPIKAGSKTAIVGYDEIFVHLNTTSRTPRGVDQNRVFAGVSQTFSKRCRIEIGYLNQFVPGHGAADKMNHVIAGTWIVSF